MKDIYDPLTEYVNVFRDRFKEITEATFAELAGEAQVDIEANHETCRQLYETEKILSSVESYISRWKAWRLLLWLGVVAGVIYIYVCYEELRYLTPRLLVLIAVAILAAIIYLCVRVRPRLKKLKSEQGDLTATTEHFKAEAWQQMSSLNRLYDWDILTRMMSQTVPRLEFDAYFTTQRLADLKAVYHWDESFNKERSVIYSHSGLINGNPFVICRTRKMNMGAKTYYGSKTIYWTERQQGSDGKYHTVQCSETLTASYTAPFPEYFEKTRLIYGNTAAPDLIFYRKQSGLAGKENSLSFKWKKRSLRKKARNLTNGDFAMMTNEEFEVAFNTSNRNNNQQFALLFTPLAQENMLKLLRDKEVGYGDDFDFDKNLMINTIIPDHMQALNLDMNPEQYRNFDYEKAKEDFYAINARYFRAIYFSLAPLLCVPMYQQIRPQQEIYGHDMERHSAFWEHEALANFWGQDHFKHPSCVTDCILKTTEKTDGEGISTIAVQAHGYRSKERVTYISKWGGDGRMHRVPVYWEEYLPVTGKGIIYMKEDNDIKEDAITHRQRLNHISDVLDKTHLNLYRRHIASKV